MNKTIFFFILLGICSSCAFHHGMMTGNAVLSNNNFKVVGITSSSSQTTKVLGIGGLNKEAMVYEAKIGLYKGINLRQGQALANISVDWKNGFYILFSKTTLTLSADIIEYLDEPVDKAELVLPIKSQNIGAIKDKLINIEDYNIPQEKIGISKYGLAIGDEVEFNNSLIYQTGRVVNFYDKGKVLVRYFDDEMISHNINILYSKLKKTGTSISTSEGVKTEQTSKYGFKIGEEVKVKYKSEMVKAKVIKHLEYGYIQVSIMEDGAEKKKKYYYTQLEKIKE